jgi:hypothetical protein
MDCRGSPLTKDEKALVWKYAKAMETNREEKLQEIINFIFTKGGNDPVIMTKATAICLQLQNEEVDHFHKAKAAGGEPKDVHVQQLEYLSMGARNLEEAVDRLSVLHVMESS